MVTLHRRWQEKVNNVSFRAVLYTALALGANAALLGPLPAMAAPERGALEALREGSLKGLSFHAEPKPVPVEVLEDGASLEDYRGKYVLLNFWAIWCAPCREEMPTLAALNEEFGGEEFAVVTLASGPNAPPAIKKFFGEIGVEGLPVLRDPRSKTARGVGVMGLPVTMILDPEGREIARLTGPADWHSESARAIVSALIEGE